MPQLQDLTSDMGLTKSNAHRGTKKKKDEIIIRLYMGFGEESSHHPTDRTFPKRLATVSNLYLLEGSISHTPGLCNGDICNSGAWSRVTAESKTRCFPDTQSFTLGVFSSQHAKHHQNDISYLEREIKSRFNALEFIGTENSDINQFLLLLF